MIDIDKIEAQCKLAMQNGYGHLPVMECGNAVKISELIDLLRQSEKDAARYRFMRDSGNFLEVGSDFDAAIDEAMKCIGDDK